MPPSLSAGWASALTMLRWKRWLAAVLTVLDGANTGIDLTVLPELAAHVARAARRPIAAVMYARTVFASSIYIDLITSISGSSGRAVDSIVRERVFP